MILRLRCLLRGGCDPQVIMVIFDQTLYIDGMVKTRWTTGQCTSCGHRHHL